MEPWLSSVDPQRRRSGSGSGPPRLGPEPPPLTYLPPWDEGAEEAVTGPTAEREDGSRPASEGLEERRPSTPRKVLVIASRFPPVASVGATRVRKFVKYLPRQGWHPVVLTGAMRQQPIMVGDTRRATDLESLSDLPPDVPVHRLRPAVDNWPGPLAEYLAGQVGRLLSRRPSDVEHLAATLRWRFQRWHDGLAFPDRGIWRLLPAVRLAVRLHRRHGFDAIFSSGMPFSDHIVGLVLQSLLRLPWLVDFRDPWVEYIHWEQWHTEWGARLTRAAEAAVIRRAACVVSVNGHMTRRFAARYGDQPARKFVTIQNGFDPADFPLGVEPDPGTFRLLYAGSLYKTRSPAAMLDGFCRFLARYPESRAHARLDFAGRPNPFVEQIAASPAGDAVQYLGMLPHSAAVREMVRSDVNVILLPNLPGGENDTTTKVYECLGSGRAILAAVPLEGAAAEVLRRFDGVRLCDPDDSEGIAAGIADLYEQWRVGRLRVSRSEADLAPFTREHEARQLAACLDFATRHRRTRRRQ